MPATTDLPGGPKNKATLPDPALRAQGESYDLRAPKREMGRAGGPEPGLGGLPVAGGVAHLDPGAPRILIIAPTVQQP